MVVAFGHCLRCLWRVIFLKRIHISLANIGFRAAGEVTFPLALFHSGEVIFMSGKGCALQKHLDIKPSTTLVPSKGGWCSCTFEVLEAQHSLSDLAYCRWPDNFTLSIFPNSSPTSPGSGNCLSMQLPFKEHHYPLLMHMALTWMGRRAKLLSFPDKSCHCRGQGGKSWALLMSYAAAQHLCTCVGLRCHIAVLGTLWDGGYSALLQHWVCDCYGFQKPLNAGITSWCKNA